MDLKRILRDSLSEILWLSGITRPGRKNASSFYIVTFHRVLPEKFLNDYPLPHLGVSTKEFEQLLSFYGKYFRCMSLCEGWEEFARKKRKNKPILSITFDDGQLDNYQYAASILNRFGIPATFFVTVDGTENGRVLWHDLAGYILEAVEENRLDPAILEEINLGRVSGDARDILGEMKKWSDREREEFSIRAYPYLHDLVPEWDGFMSWEELIELRDKGHEIGCHSYSHSLMDKCDDLKLVREIQESKNIIEANLGSSIKSFCYPNGNYDERSISLLDRSGYTLAVTTNWGRNRSDENVYSLKRQNMTSEHSRNRNGRFSIQRVAMRMAGIRRSK